MENQFTRTETLIGKEALEKLRSSYVAIFGVGGVGGYVAEALARAGIEKFDLIERKIWTGFSSFDFVLNYKKAEFDRKRINFFLDIDIQQIEIPEDDLMIILGNLLDNAMEAAEKCENKYIKLKSRNINNMLLLKIENSSTQLPQVKNGVFISNKNNKNEHGFGIESVKRIVDEHEGEIHFQYSENYFQVEILI